LRGYGVFTLYRLQIMLYLMDSEIENEAAAFVEIWLNQHAGHYKRNRQNRFEPAIRFILEAKQAIILLAERNQEKNRGFLKKIGSNFQMAEKSLAVELAERGGFEPPIRLLTV